MIRRTIRRRWAMILVLTILPWCAALAAIYLLTPPRYKATGILRVRSATLLSILDAGPIDPAAERRMVRTQMLLATTPDVLNAALQDPKVQNTPLIRGSYEPEVVLREALLVEQVEDSSLFTISLVGVNPSESSTLVNAVIGAFKDASDAWSSGELQRSMAQLKDLQKEYRSASVRQEQSKQEIVSNYIGSLKDMNPGHLSVAEAQGIRDEIARAGREFLKYQSQIDALQDADGADEPRLADLKWQREAVRRYEESLRERLASSGIDADGTARFDREMQELAFRIDATRKRLETIENALFRLEATARGDSPIAVAALARTAGCTAERRWPPLYRIADVGLVCLVVSSALSLIREARAGRATLSGG